MFSEKAMIRFGALIALGTLLLQKGLNAEQSTDILENNNLSKAYNFSEMLREPKGKGKIYLPLRLQSNSFSFGRSF